MWNNNYIEYKSNGDKNGNSPLDKYLNKIEPYLMEYISIDQLSIAISIFKLNFRSKNIEEERVMHSDSDNRKFTPYNDKNEVVDELFESLHSRYQGNLEISMRGSDFIFDPVQLTYYKCDIVNFSRDGSYIDSPDRIKKKINLNNTDDKCFQYAAIVALNYEEIESYPEGVSNIKPFINKYNWKEINYLWKIEDQKIFEKNNSTITLNIFYIKEKERCPACIWKVNSNCEKEILLLLIPNEEKRNNCIILQ